ncbi:Uridine 5'-monophosphate synthase, partial [Bienertia sinuspersici]
MIKTRSSQHELLYYNPEIERTLRRIRKEQRKIQVDLEFNLEKLFEEERQVHNQSVQYQQKTNTHLQNIDNQIGTICTSLSNFETQLTVTLKSGKELVSPKVKSREVEKEIEVISKDKISDEN